MRTSIRVRRLAGLPLVAALLGGPAAGAQEQELRYRVSAGVDVSRGDYAQDRRTDIVYLPVSVKLERGRWSGRLTLAHLRVTGPAGASTLGAPGAARERQSGLGDVVASVTYATEVSLLGVTYLDLTAKLKIPTADEDRGLGTGSADVTVQVEAFRTHGPWTPSAALGYRELGDAPGLALGGGVIVSAGLDRRLARHFSAGALLDYREAVARRADDALEMVPYLSWRVGNGFTLTGYGIVGLADGSPERGFGLQLSFRSGR